MKPGTPLPWRWASEVGQNVVAAEHREICECYQDGEVLEKADNENAAYIVHAANAYPRLVEALRVLMPLLDQVPVFQLDDGKASVKAVRLAGKFMGATKSASALLRELGEAS